MATRNVTKTRSIGGKIYVQVDNQEQWYLLGPDNYTATVIQNFDVVKEIESKGEVPEIPTQKKVSISEAGSPIVQLPVVPSAEELRYINQEEKNLVAGQSFKINNGGVTLQIDVDENAESYTVTNISTGKISEPFQGISNDVLKNWINLLAPGETLGTDGNSTEPKILESPSESFMNHAKEMQELGVLDPEIKKIICDTYPDLCAELNSTVQIPFNKQTPDQLLKSLREQQRQKNIKDGKITATCPALSDTTGKTIILADPCKDNFFAKLEAYLTNFFDKITKIGGAIANFGEDLKTTVKLIVDAASIFIGKLVSGLTKAINKWISNGLASLTQQIFNTVSLPAQAMLKVVGVEKDLLNPVKALNKALACLTSKITQALTSVVEDLLMGMVRNVLNVPVCAVQQYIGALTTKIINLIDSAVTPLLGPIQNILGIVFKVRDFLVGAVKTIRKLLSFLKCGEKEECPPSRKYKIDKGLLKDKDENEQDDLIGKISSGNALSQGTENLINDFERQYGKWNIFGSKLSDVGDQGIGGSNCNSGNVFECGAPKVNFFGGDGVGAAGQVILGKFMREFDTQNIGGDVKRTASIIGVDLVDPGQEYTEAPFVSFEDNCDQGYGAYGRAIIDKNINSPTYGQVKSIVIISEGENYPISIPEQTGIQDNLEDDDVYIKEVLVENPGTNYQDDDILESEPKKDDLKIIIEDGKVSSVTVTKLVRYSDLPKLNIRTETGYGAVLRPIMTTIKPIRAEKTEIAQQIDCITP